MSELNVPGLASPNQATPAAPSRDDDASTPASTSAQPPTSPGMGARSSRRVSFTWPAALILIACLAFAGSGAFAAHQILTYGTLIPSIAGGWYGPFSVAQ